MSRLDFHIYNYTNHFYTYDVVRTGYLLKTDKRGFTTFHSSSKRSILLIITIGTSLSIENQDLTKIILGSRKKITKILGSRNKGGG